MLMLNLDRLSFVVAATATQKSHDGIPGWPCEVAR